MAKNSNIDETMRCDHCIHGFFQTLPSGKLKGYCKPTGWYKGACSEKTLIKHANSCGMFEEEAEFIKKREESEKRYLEELINS